MSVARPIALFDADCGFCTRSARAVGSRWFRTRVAMQALQRAPLPELGLDLDECLATMHAVDVDGTVLTGHRAWALILRHSRFPWPIVGRALLAPGLTWLAERGYRWIARHRRRLPGGSASCELPPTD